MALSAFDDRTREPRPGELAAALAGASGPWDELKRRVIASCGPMTEVWACSSSKSGWTMRLVRGKRNILYMTPCHGHFIVSFALGEKAVAAAHASDLSEAALEVIDEAPRYAEGRGVRLDVRCAADVADIVRLAEIKVAH